MKSIDKVMPIIGWLRDYKKEDLKGDLYAGFSVGIILIPQGMAYALIAGLPPVYGLYAAILPQIIYAIFGSSRQLSVGPVAMDSLLVASGVSMFATEGTGAYIEYAILLTFLVGAFHLLLGTLRLGFITNLLSKPVISGFTSAVAIIIGLNQLKYLLGIELQRSNQAFIILEDIIIQISHVHVITLVIGVFGILMIHIGSKVNNNFPTVLVLVVTSTLLVWSINLDAQGVSIVGTLPQGLPSFQLPTFSLDRMQSLLSLALTISIVSYMEAFSVGKALEAKERGSKVVPNQELIALGLANTIGSLFQAYPVTGGFSRSAVNYASGARTSMASIISAALVVLTLLFLTKPLHYLPNAVLASIIMVAVGGLIDWDYAQQLWKNNKIEFLLFLMTFLVTVNIGVTIGIASGVILSLLMLLYKAAYPHIAQLGRVKGHHEFRNMERFKDLEVWESILILRVDSSLTFVNVQYFKEYVMRAIDNSSEEIETVILDAGPISYLDATASYELKELLKVLEEINVRFLVCDLIGPVRDQFQKNGLIDMLSRENILLDLNEAIRFATTNHKGRYQKYALQSNID